MNKFVLIALFAASVALAAAAPIDEETSELALNPSDDQETAGLRGTNLEAFSAFCKESRDSVVGDMKSRGNIFASDLFAQIFRSISDVGESSLGTTDQLIADGKKEIMENDNQPKGFLNAVKGGVQTFFSAGYGTAISKVMELQSKVGAMSLTNNLIGLCEQLSSYERQTADLFEETKKALVAENPEQYKDVKYLDVAPKCMTANRLARAEGFCQLALGSKDVLAKMFNFKLPASNAEQ